MKTLVVQLEVPPGCNVILGHSHFVKTVEDLYDVLASGAPTIKFGLAFNEASQECLVRHTGNDEELEAVAIKNIEILGAGHCFLIYMKEAFPINVLPAIRQVPEIVRIFCATANPVQVLLAETDQGRGILGVIDGASPLGVESPEDQVKRRDFLRIIGYKES